MFNAMEPPWSNCRGHEARNIPTQFKTMMRNLLSRTDPWPKNNYYLWHTMYFNDPRKFASAGALAVVESVKLRNECKTQAAGNKIKFVASNSTRLLFPFVMHFLMSISRELPTLENVLQIRLININSTPMYQNMIATNVLSLKIFTASIYRVLSSSLCHELSNYQRSFI